MSLSLFVFFLWKGATEASGFSDSLPKDTHMPEDAHSVSVVKLEVNAHSPQGYKSRILMDSLEWKWILFSSRNLWCLLSKLNHSFLWSAHSHTKGWGERERVSMWDFIIRPLLKRTQGDNTCKDIYCYHFSSLSFLKADLGFITFSILSVSIKCNLTPT